MDREVGVSSKPSKQKLGAATKAAKAAARKATIAKGVATKKADKGVVWKKADKGVVRAAVTVMLMTAGSVLSDKLAPCNATCRALTPVLLYYFLQLRMVHWRTPPR